MDFLEHKTEKEKFVGRIYVFHEVQGWIEQFWTVWEPVWGLLGLNYVGNLWIASLVQWFLIPAAQWNHWELIKLPMLGLTYPIKLSGGGALTEIFK